MVNSPLSLLDQIELLLGHHFHINVIKVSESFSSTDDQVIDFALRRMREIFAVSGVRIGIGRIRRSFISDAKAAQVNASGGILVDGDAELITERFSGKDGALDLFVVQRWGPDFNTLGRSAVDGTCDKDDTCEMTGTVVSVDVGVSGSQGRVARTFAHEVAHYLGLDELEQVVNPVCDPGPGTDISSSGDDDTIGSVYNLMADPDDYETDPEKGLPDLCNYTVNPELAVDLTPAQGETMREHCFISSCFIFNFL